MRQREHDMSTPMHAIRFVVQGKVQGVWFRDSTRERALALNLRGHADNRPDGTVEVLAAGDPEALDALAEWLRHGPPLARVVAVSRNPANPAEAGDGFTIG